MKLKASVLFIIFCISTGLLKAQFYLTVDNDKQLFFEDNQISEIPFIYKKNKDDKFKRQKSVSVNKSGSDSLVSGTISLEKMNDLKDLREFFEDMDQKLFYVNDVQIDVSSLKNEEELTEEIRVNPYNGEYYHFTTACNDSANFEYYEFQLFYFESKLLNMKLEDYYTYLMNGKVSEFERKARYFQKAKNNYSKK